jgi:hypothetical protein
MVRVWIIRVNQDKMRLVGFYLFNCLINRPRFPGNLDPRLSFQKIGEPFAKEGITVNNEYLEHSETLPVFLQTCLKEWLAVFLSPDYRLKKMYIDAH